MRGISEDDVLVLSYSSCSAAGSAGVGFFGRYVRLPGCLSAGLREVRGMCVEMFDVVLGGVGAAFDVLLPCRLETWPFGMR